MPTPDPTKIRIAGTGAIWKAPVGSTAPTDSTTALAGAWLNLGYVSNGFEITQELKTKEIEVWQSLEIVRQIATGLSRTVQFEAVESNNQTVALAFNGATITAGTAGAYTMSVPSSYQQTEFALVLDATDGTTSMRVYIPRAVLNAVPKITAGREDAITYNFEIQVLQPSDGTSNPITVFGKDAGVAS